GFYPSDPGALGAALDDAFARATPPAPAGRVIGLVVPHAGYEYSASVAAKAYTLLRGAPPGTIVLLGPSHRVPVTGGAIAEYDSWRTPLGEIRVDLDVARGLCRTEPLFRIDSAPHAEEHCLEVQLPFIQRVAPEARIVPVAVGGGAEASGTAQRLADALAAVLRGRDAVVVASSDMSHYPETSDCERVDRAMLVAIASLDPHRLIVENTRQLESGVRGLECTLCGLSAVEVAVRAVRGLGAHRSQVLAYANSGQVVPSTRHRSVGYGAVAFLGEGAVAGDGPAALNAAQRARLIAVAREAIRARLRGEPLESGQSTDPVLMHPAAVFVTLTKSGQLRGCIGCTEPELPLMDAVAHYAELAAFSDHRFQPVRDAELPELCIEISVLSPLVRVTSPDDIVLGTHGVMVTQNGRRGLFLPQVATEHSMSRDEFLTRLCTEKAGLPGDAWQHGAQLFVFTVERFSEERGAS
ncbi:MAG TPA: AmmeMemoRadiSam system protein B, partial [Armatimonadota bacterium]|nr:AmmeMemoRadiSam system protein B [Armatimonadota bacterium]